MGRISIVLDDKLIEKALEITGASSKKEAVDIALRYLVDKHSLHQSIKKLAGKLECTANIDDWRKSRK